MKSISKWPVPASVGPSSCDDGGATWFFSSYGGILELRRGIQAASCVGPGKSNLPFELRRKAGDCSRVTAIGNGCVWRNVFRRDSRLARRPQLPRGDCREQHRSRREQGDDQIAPVALNRAHHRLVGSGVRAALFKLGEHLVNDAHCCAIDTIASEAATAAPANDSAQTSQSRRTSGVSAAASRICRDNTCWRPSPNASIIALCATILTSLGVPPVMRCSLPTAPLLNSVSPPYPATARRWRR